jgi:hypothetical protein
LTIHLRPPTPAQVHGWVCQCGGKLDFGSDNQARCPQCSKIYLKRGDRIEMKGGD